MSLQWTLIATFLYTEIFLCSLLMLPFISPKRWQKVFRSKLLAVFHSYANLYFNIFVVVLVVLFADSIRDVRKYSATEPDLSHPGAEATLHMKLFRAQRNFYIALFALYLFVVLRRMVTLLSSQATLMASNEASLKQAQSASDVAEKLMAEKTQAGGESKDNAANEESSSVEELERAHKDVEILREELAHSHTNLDAMKSQAESTKTEYDRLLDEHAQLQSKLEVLEGSEGSKKDD